MINITTSKGVKTFTLGHIAQYLNSHVFESANYVLNVFAQCFSSIEVVLIKIVSLTTEYVLCQA